MSRGQIWVETVIYTLIAFALIGAVLAFVKPKIEEIQDKAIIEQSISLLKSIDSSIAEIVQGGSGNVRKIELSVKKGDFIIDGENNSLRVEIDSRFLYSEPGEEIENGNLKIITTPIGDESLVVIRRDYSHNITFNDEKIVRVLSQAATPYNLLASNKGKVNDTWNVNFKLS